MKSLIRKKARASRKCAGGRNTGTVSRRKIRRFFRKVFRRHPIGSNVFLAARSEGQFILRSFKVSDRLYDEICEFIAQHPPERFDLYFCANCFSRPKLRKQYAKLSNIAHCDIDGADPASFVPPPNIVTETSPGSYHGWWFFNQRIRPEKAEAISKWLTYEFGGDLTGWAITKLLRIPFTINHKRQYEKPEVKIISEDWTPVDHKPILDKAGYKRPRRIFEPIYLGPDDNLNQDPRQVLRKYWRQIKNHQVKALLKCKKLLEPDRSKAIYIIAKGLYDGLVPWPDIACLTFHSVYFQSKHGSDVDALEAEISRLKHKFEMEEGS